MLDDTSGLQQVVHMAKRYMPSISSEIAGQASNPVLNDAGLQYHALSLEKLLGMLGQPDQRRGEAEMNYHALKLHRRHALRAANTAWQSLHAGTSWLWPTGPAPTLLACVRSLTAVEKPIAATSLILSHPAALSALAQICAIEASGEKFDVCHLPVEMRAEALSTLHLAYMQAASKIEGGPDLTTRLELVVEIKRGSGGRWIGPVSALYQLATQFKDSPGAWFESCLASLFINKSRITLQVGTLDLENLIDRLVETTKEAA